MRTSRMIDERICDHCGCVIDEQRYPKHNTTLTFGRRNVAGREWPAFQYDLCPECAEEAEMLVDVWIRLGNLKGANPVMDAYKKRLEYEARLEAEEESE